LKEGSLYDSSTRAGEKVILHTKKHPNNKKYIFTLLIEPVSREISNFMQNPKDYIESDILTY
tara:strand:+ start:522 stop:707 length:186 start_codon:yes stop_codon:yes gene_type:complete